MGFADSVSGAKSRYSRLIHDKEELEINVKEDFSLYRVDRFAETGDLIKWKDYDVRYRMVFEEVKDYSKEEMDFLEFHTQAMYPELCL